MQKSAQPSAVRNSPSFVPLAQVLKQIDAPVGAVGLASLAISTYALRSNDSGDVTYNNIENRIASFTTQRDAIAAQILVLLEGAEFNNQPISEKQAQQLLNQAQSVLQQMQNMAGNTNQQ
jgi:hypothetical protein